MYCVDSPRSQLCRPANSPGFSGTIQSPGILLHNPGFNLRRAQCVVIVVRARDLPYTHIHVFDSAQYLGPARDVKLEKRLDVCAQGKRASKITLLRTDDQYARA